MTIDVNCNGKARPFRFWCQKILPAVYDDSLSYYELLCKLFHLINEDREAINANFDAIMEIQALLDKWLSGGFNPDIERAVDEWFDEHGDELAEIINQFIEDNPEIFNEFIEQWFEDNPDKIDDEIDGWFDKPDNQDLAKYNLSVEPRGYSSLWMEYFTGADTIRFYDEIKPWITSNSYVRIGINPSINLMLINLRIFFQKALDTDTQSPTYNQMITINQRLEQLGLDNNSPHYIPLFDLPEQRSTNALKSLDFPIEIRRAQTDGKYYQVHGITDSVMYANGSFAIYTYPQNFWRTADGEDYPSQLWCDCARIYNVGYEYSRYNLRTAEENRNLFVSMLQSRIGHWMYRQTGYNDTREDTTYIDCSGLIWWGLWYGCNLPLSSYGGDAQEHAGEYVTSARAGEKLDISVMKPGDIITLGYVPYVATEGLYYGQTTYSFTKQFSRSTHMCIYLGENKFIHITDGWKNYGFTWEQGTAYDTNPSVIQESQIYPGVKLLSHGYRRTNDNGVWRANGPFVFEGADVYKAYANTVTVETMGETETFTTKAYYRTVVRYFSDTKSWMVD